MFTIVLELGLPFLIWYPRWRPFMVMGSVMLHTGIALTMGMTSFSLLMIIMLAAFFPAAGVRRLIDRLREARSGSPCSSAPASLAGCGAALVKAVDPQPGPRPRPCRAAGRGRLARPGDVPQLVSAAGSLARLRGLRAPGPVVRLLWPLGLLTWVPGVGRVGRLFAPAEPREKPAEAAGVGS